MMTAMIHVKNTLPEMKGRAELDKILPAMMDPIEKQGGLVPKVSQDLVKVSHSSNGKHRTYRVTINAETEVAATEWHGTWHYCPTCRKGRDHVSPNGGLTPVGDRN